VAAGTVGDEEQIARGAPDWRRLPARRGGIGDRPGGGRQPHRWFVGEACGFQTADGPAQRSFRRPAIDDGRIGLQLLSLPQACDEHRGDATALVSLPVSFSTIEGQGNQLVRRLDRNVWIAPLPDFRKPAFLRLLHARITWSRVVRAEFVGFRHKSLARISLTAPVR